MKHLTKREHMRHFFYDSRAFTLIEMLITLAITGIVMSAVYAVYIASLNTAVTEEHRVDLQQNHRFAMDLLMSQLRHAGYDKTDALLPKIEKAGQDYIYFTADYSGCDQNEPPTSCTKSSTGLFPDGEINDPGEHIVFCTYTDADGIKQLGFVNSDGIDGSPDTGNGPPDFVIGNIDTDDDGIADIGHTHGGKTHQPIIAIQEIEFFYELSTGSPTLFPTDTELIRSVKVSLLSRSEKEDKKLKQGGTRTYAPASGAGPWTGYADGIRRRFTVVEVNFRNMGL